jgi:hypothetical protein
VVGCEVEVVADDSTVVVGEEVEEETAGVVVVVVDARVVLVVVAASVMTGAATFSGAMGLSLTRSSAALTICQVTVVDSPTTTSQPKKSVNRLTP